MAIVDQLITDNPHFLRTSTSLGLSWAGDPQELCPFARYPGLGTLWDNISSPLTFYLYCNYLHVTYFCCSCQHFCIWSPLNYQDSLLGPRLAELAPFKNQRFFIVPKNHFSYQDLLLQLLLLLSLLLLKFYDF